MNIKTSSLSSPTVRLCRLIGTPRLRTHHYLLNRKKKEPTPLQCTLCRTCRIRGTIKITLESGIIQGVEPPYVRALDHQRLACSVAVESYGNGVKYCITYEIESSAVAILHSAMALMNWSSSSSSSSWMVAQAKEELEVLEAMHPNRFGYLKLELKSFIAEESDQYKLFASSSSSLSPVSTQVSVCEASSSRKRKSQEVHKMSDKCRRLNGSKGRFDAAIKRAQACLRKIREVKRSFDTVGNAT